MIDYETCVGLEDLDVTFIEGFPEVSLLHRAQSKRFLLTLNLLFRLVRPLLSYNASSHHVSKVRPTLRVARIGE